MITFSCGYGKRVGVGELGFDGGGDGGRGVMGECHDCTLWKESDDSVGEWASTGSAGSIGSSVMAAGFGADFDGGDVKSVSCGGAVTARLDAKLVIRPFLTRMRPAPSNESFRISSSAGGSVSNTSSFDADSLDSSGSAMLRSLRILG